MLSFPVVYGVKLKMNWPGRFPLFSTTDQPARDLQMNKLATKHCEICRHCRSVYASRKCTGTWCVKLLFSGNNMQLSSFLLDIRIVARIVWRLYKTGFGLTTGFIGSHTVTHNYSVYTSQLTIAAATLL
jgi:hypothetical protein